MELKDTKAQEAGTQTEEKKIDLDRAVQDVLNMIDSYGFKQEGAYNLRLNGMAVCHGDSRHIHQKKAWTLYTTISILRTERM